MIQANELRIGNWIQINNGDGKRPPYNYGITSHDIEEIDRYGDDYFPIKLTPEILEKCGFESRTVTVKDRYGENTSNHFDIELEGGNNIFLLEQNVDGVKFFIFESPVTVYVRYLHQLQNLYFALTGEELTVKL